MQSSEPSVSIVIPTFNGGERVAELLEFVTQQDVDPAFEVLIVDNQSTDDTSALIRRSKAWKKLVRRGVPCKIVLEPKRGLTHARIAGITAARAPLVCILDDDNCPVPQYLRAGLAAMDDPSVGLLVSRIEASYAVEPPFAIRSREHLLAVNYRLGDRVVRWRPEDRVAPTLGAGMWVRREAFLSAVPWQAPESLMSDRVGNALAGGGDIEIGIRIGHAGHVRQYVPELQLTHKIPARRCEFSYFCKLIIGTIRSELTLQRRYQFGTPVEPRLQALARLALALASVPYLMVARRDPLREVAFVLSARWARVLGPFGSSE